MIPLRRVRTPDGARFYGVPIGTPIVADAVVPTLRKPKYVLTDLDAGLIHDRRDRDRRAVRRARWMSPAAWNALPVTDVPISGLRTIERDVSPGPVDRVVSGREPFRDGYEVLIVQDIDGERIIVDGHHRAAMHAKLGHDTLPARVFEATPQITELDPDVLDEEVDALMERVRVVEPEITGDLTELVEWLGPEARLEKLDRRFKTDAAIRSRVQRSVADIVASGRDVNTSRAVRDVPDALRYTLVVDAEAYSDAIADLMDELADLGYENVRGGWANSWTSTAYRGMNLRLVKHGVIIEIQMHTPESLAAKQQTHKIYEYARELPVGDPERVKLFNDMKATMAAVTIPTGAATLSWPGPYAKTGAL